MLNDKAEDGEYKIPFLVVCDAFQSEMTAFADLILPDTTYLERHDVHVHARPADLRVRRPGGFGAHPGAAPRASASPSRRC
jgi:anaerobic selenocysteine-containing dehydrogenase